MLSLPRAWVQPRVREHGIMEVVEQPKEPPATTTTGPQHERHQ